MIKITEKDSLYQDIDQMGTLDILTSMNQEDKKVPLAVEKSIDSIAALVDIIAAKLADGGRLFYIGAGTSGRLGILDASECPPTYGVAPELVTGLIAGGEGAIMKAVEGAEDSHTQGWIDLVENGARDSDVIVGIAASGTTPYVIGAIKEAKKNGVTTGCITCNLDSPLASEADYPIEVPVGPEFITGSTRMKAGTAQKLVLNMISTSVMVKLGRVKGNKMVDMQISNLKLQKRGIQMIMKQCDTDYETASNLLQEHGSVRLAVEAYNTP